VFFRAKPTNTISHCNYIHCSRMMSTLLLNHVDINSSQCVSPFPSQTGSGGLAGSLGGCLGGVRPASRDSLRVAADGAWYTHTEYSRDPESCVTSYDASSAAVVAAARFMQGYRYQHQQQDQNAMLSGNSSSTPSSPPGQYSLHMFTV